MHIDCEVRHSLVLRCFRIGARHQHSPMCEVRHCVPHFLTIDDPFITITNCTCTKTCKVATCAWLGEQLTPQLLASKHRTKETCLHFFATVRDDCWTCKCHEERCGVLRCGTCLAHALFNHAVEFWTKSETAVTFREVNPCKTCIETCATERDIVNLLWVELGKKCIECLFNDCETAVCRSGGAHTRSLAVLARASQIVRNAVN